MNDDHPSPSFDNRYSLDVYVNKRAVAARHRAFLMAFLVTVGLFLVLLGLIILPVHSWTPFSILSIVYIVFKCANGWNAIQACRLKYALGENLFFSLLFGALLLFPIINLIAVIYVHREAAALLRRAGLRIGFLGVSEKEYERRFSPWLCNWCDYDLTGNRSGICSECGNEIPASMLPILEQRESELAVT